MPSEHNPSDQDIEKMLEQARVKTVPPQILKGFKEDVMRRIAVERRAKPGIWVSPGWKLPRIGMTVGAGAFACLLIASIAVFTTRLPEPTPTVHQAGLASTHPDTFQVASLPAGGALNAPMDAVRMSAAALIRTEAAQQSVPAQASMVRPTGSTAAPAKKLTVEEELRLIEEFDDQRFFIRQDITDDALAAA